LLAALTIATMPARIAQGRVGHCAITANKSGWVGVLKVELLGERLGAIPSPSKMPIFVGVSTLERQPSKLHVASSSLVSRFDNDSAESCVILGVG